MDEQPVGLRAPIEGGKAHADLLQAQMRDARAKIFKLEEVNETCDAFFLLKQALKSKYHRYIYIKFRSISSSSSLSLLMSPSSSLCDIHHFN